MIHELEYSLRSIWGVRDVYWLGVEIAWRQGCMLETRRLGVVPTWWAWRFPGWRYYMQLRAWWIVYRWTAKEHSYCIEIL